MAPSQNPEAGERRGHFRGRSGPGRRVDVIYSRIDGDDCATGEAAVTSVTGNIGVGGAFILGELPEPLETVLRLELNVPAEGIPLLLRGTVRWIQTSDSKGMGIKFEPLSVDELLALHNYFSTL